MVGEEKIYVKLWSIYTGKQHCDQLHASKQKKSIK